MSEEQNVNQENVEQSETENTQNESTQENQTSERNEKRYSDEDVDRIVNEKYAKWKKQAEKEALEREEAEKFKSMTAEEQTKKRLDDMEKELNAYKEREKFAEMKNVARGYFVDENISISDNMLNVLVTGEADTTKENVENYIKTFREEVDRGINSKLAGKTPTVQKHTGTTTKTKEEIMAIKDTTKRRELIAQNPHLFK